MKKSLKDIAWNVEEEQYRQDPALSYSTLAKYERTGFNGLNTLFDKVESPSLILGSAVDAIITGGEGEFNSRFIVAEFPAIKDSVIQIVKSLFFKYKDTYASITEIPEADVLETIIEYNFQNNWKPETRVKVVKESGAEYYSLMHISQDKTILSTSTYRDVYNMVDALKHSNATSWYFQDDNPFDGIERLYQLKFKATLADIDYRIMADLIIVDHNNKTIQPIDLKTSSHKEYDFHKSFVEWMYMIQARLYYRVILDNIMRDEYFKEFKILDYLFIVVNKVTLNPLVWKCGFTKTMGEITMGKNNQIVMRDPFTIGTELKGYLDNTPKVPNGIVEYEPNDLNEWINRL